MDGFSGWSWRRGGGGGSKGSGSTSSRASTRDVVWGAHCSRARSALHGPIFALLGTGRSSSTWFSSSRTSLSSRGWRSRRRSSTVRKRCGCSGTDRSCGGPGYGVSRGPARCRRSFYRSGLSTGCLLSRRARSFDEEGRWGHQVRRPVQLHLGRRAQLPLPWLREPFPARAWPLQLGR